MAQDDATIAVVERPEPAPSALAKKNLTMVLKSGRRLSNLVDEILDFSKMKSGKHYVILVIA